jgi:hypothetical protein
MAHIDWSARVPTHEMQRRAGGRRGLNAVRQFRADLRRLEVSRRLRAYGLLRRGAQARIARELGVSEATISRDVAVLMGTAPRAGRCPLCGRGGLDDLDWGLGAGPGPGPHPLRVANGGPIEPP